MADESKFRDKGNIDDHIGKDIGKDLHRPMEHDRDDKDLGYQGTRKEDSTKGMPHDKDIGTGYRNDKDMKDKDTDYNKDKGMDYDRK